MLTSGPQFICVICGFYFCFAIVPERSYTFPRTHRLSKREEYSRVFEARVREARGPIMAYALPNGLPHLRFGISLGRAVGNAVRRNRIKRML